MQDLDMRSIATLTGSVSLQREGSRLVLCLSGEIDWPVLQAFEPTCGRRPVPVNATDARAVTFCSASAVALLLRVRAASKPAGRVAGLRRSSSSADGLVGLQQRVRVGLVGDTQGIGRRAMP